MSRRSIAASCEPKTIIDCPNALRWTMSPVYREDCVRTGYFYSGGLARTDRIVRSDP